MQNFFTFNFGTNLLIYNKYGNMDILGDGTATGGARRALSQSPLSAVPVAAGGSLFRRRCPHRCHLKKGDSRSSRE